MAIGYNSPPRVTILDRKGHELAIRPTGRAPTCLSFDLSGETLLVGVGDELVELDGKSGEPRQTKTSPGAVYCLALHDRLIARGGQWPSVLIEARDGLSEPRAFACDS